MSTKRRLNLADFVIRPALTSDYDGVMAISRGLYNGDTLPAVYFEHLEDPTRVYYVAVHKLNGKVAAFAGGRMVDNGETLDGQHARTDANLRGLGLHRAIRTTLLRDSISKKWPNFKRQRVVTENLEELKRNVDLTIIHSANRVSRDLIWKMQTREFLRSLSRIRIPNSEHDRLQMDRMKRASSDDIEFVFKHQASHMHLFPSGIIIKDSQAFNVGRNYLSNIALLMSDRLQAIYLTKAVAAHETFVNSISFGTAIEWDVNFKSMLYSIDYYGDPKIDLIKGHVFKHLQEIPQCLQRSCTAECVCLYFGLPRPETQVISLDDVAKFVVKDLEFRETPSAVEEQYVGEQCMSRRNIDSMESKL